MHGLINRAIEEFARVTYGDALWTASASAAGADPRGFVIMRHYETSLTGRLMGELSQRLGQTPFDLAEDIGAWVSQIPSVRRLLRFGGSDFDGFVMALQELHGRALMVVRGLYLPPFTVQTLSDGWRLRSDCDPMWLHAIAGMLHAMADDYGVLALVEVEGDAIVVNVPLTEFTTGRPFSLTEPSVGVA